jgi:pyruvate kinase
MIEIKNIRAMLHSMEMSMQDHVVDRNEVINSLHPTNQKAGKNLIEYLTLRSADIRELQDLLHILGLSSLASSESHIKSQLQAISQRLGKKYNLDQLDDCNFEWSLENKKVKSKNLLGEKENEVLPSIMVTFDKSFADDYSMIKNLLLNGMNLARINCAHDDETIWAAMIEKVKKACHKTGKTCKIYMDMGGPKIRIELIGKGSKKGKANLKEGDLIYLSDGCEDMSHKAIIINPGMPEIISSLKTGDRVYFDDGMIRGIIVNVKGQIATVRITRISSSKKMIKNGKGINFPDSELDIAPLTDYDISCLPFICENADIIGYSFARFPSDIKILQNLISEISKTPPNMVIKIETPEAVKYLPDLLLEGMKNESIGIMIARGDLAVEIGFERMSEIQDEILWICEAAHVPVIWATQVLESMNKSGLATRSEMTDAGHATQAECIMLNKGTHTIEVLETLKDISLRHSEHRSKKRYTFRPLSIAQEFIKNGKEA